MAMDSDFKKAMDSLLRQAIVFDGAQKGLLQMYDPEEQVLRVVAHVGFGERFLKLFEVVRAFDASACGRALGLRDRVIIKDVRTEVAFVPFLDVVSQEGFRSVKAIPLFFKDNSIAGVISTHFVETQNALFSKGEIPEEHLSMILRRLQSERFNLLAS